MKVSLRKAHALQQEINRVLGEIPLRGVVELDESTPADRDVIENVIEIHTQSFREEVARYDRLVDGLAEIRNSVARVNSEIGVDSLLSKLAAVDRMIRVLSDINLAGDVVDGGDTAAISYKLKRLQDPEAHSKIPYRRENSLRVRVANEADLRGMLSELRRERARLNDQLLESNIRGGIQLSPDLERLLRDEGVI